MCEGAVIAVATILLRAAASALVAGTVVHPLLTQSRLENMWVQDHLLPCVRIWASQAGSAVILHTLGTTSGALNHDDVRADLWGVIISAWLPTWPLNIVRVLALCSPTTHTISGQTLATLRPEDVELLVVAPKVGRHCHGEWKLLVQLGVTSY